MNRSIKDHVYLFTEQDIVGSVQHGSVLLANQGRALPCGGVSEEGPTSLSKVDIVALLLQKVDLCV